MELCVTGASGLIGSAVCTRLIAQGHRIRRLSHRRGAPNAYYWEPATGELDRQAIVGVDAVVHLAGENIASGRWTQQKKDRIRRSRVEGTGLLCRQLAELENPPRVLIAASAIGYYGSRGDELLTEESEPGRDFLAEVCRQWEAETRTAQDKGIRVVNLRTGVVLATEGGALAKMLPVMRMGLGGRVGDGKQWWSWIARQELANIVLRAVEDPRLEGPVNAVAPEPVRNAEFTRTLAHVLGRPAVVPLPTLAARALVGEMADALLLSSARVVPQRLQSIDYDFHWGTLEPALRAILEGE